MKNQRSATVSEMVKLMGKQKMRTPRGARIPSKKNYINVEMNRERRKTSNKKCPQTWEGMRAVIPVLFAVTPAGVEQCLYILLPYCPLSGTTRKTICCYPGLFMALTV